MGQKVEVSGTAYDLKSGKCLIAGTGYNLKKGRTLVDGTGYDIKFKSGETWKLNATPKMTPLAWGYSTRTYNVSFVTNDTQCTRFELYPKYGSWPTIDYIYISYPVSGGTTLMTAYYGQSDYWTNEAYRTLFFEEAPTGELRTWLEGNATLL